MAETTSEELPGGRAENMPNTCKSRVLQEIELGEIRELWRSERSQWREANALCLSLLGKG